MKTTPTSRQNLAEEQKIIRVIVADDHPIVRKGIVDELSRHSNVEILGEASNGDEALDLSLTLMPDVLLLDISMPGAKPAHVVRELNKLEMHPRVLVLSAYDDLEYVLSMLSAGASGYMLKDEEPSTIAQGVLSVSKGETWLSPDIAASLVQHSIRAAGLSKQDELTARERDVLVLLAKGYPNEQIAETLFIAEGTVKNHVTHIYDKLGVSSRAKAVAWAWEHGLVKP
jgi:DNA-binding NarL/FixJ family response regulator